MQGQAIARAERGAREGMETESNSGPHGNWNHGGSDPMVAPANLADPDLEASVA